MKVGTGVTPGSHRGMPMILRSRWICPNCPELLPTRHWSVLRHIHRKHDGKGDPISINTRQTRTQMNMVSGYLNSNRTSSNSSELGHDPHEQNNFVESRKIPFGRPQYIPDSQKNASPTEEIRNAPDGTKKILTEGFTSRSEGAATNRGNTLTWKLSEIKRLSRPYYQPQVVDEALSTILLLVMIDKRSESVLDDILEKLRYNANPLPELFLRYLEFMDSNLKETANEKPLRGHHVEDIPEGVETTLTKIKLLLDPHYHPNDVWEVIKDLKRRYRATG